MKNLKIICKGGYIKVNKTDGSFQRTKNRNLNLKTCRKETNYKVFK